MDPVFENELNQFRQRQEMERSAKSAWQAAQRLAEEAERQRWVPRCGWGAGSAVHGHVVGGAGWCLVVPGSAGWSRARLEMQEKSTAAEQRALEVRSTCQSLAS